MSQDIIGKARRSAINALHRELLDSLLSVVFFRESTDDQSRRDDASLRGKAGRHFSIALFGELPPRMVAAKIFENLLGDPEFKDAMSVLLEVERERGRSDALTSEEAAELLGFSVSYTKVLLDSDEFKGKVSRTAGGHRRVPASAIKEWMHARGLRHPLSEEDVKRRDEPSPPEFFEDVPETIDASIEAAERRIAEFDARSLKARAGRE